MAAVSLFWNTNMAAVTSCENTLLLVHVWFLAWVLSCVLSIFCIASFGDGTRPLHQSIANNGSMLSILVETMCWFSISSCIWPFDFLLPWYCPHLPTPVITDRRQNLFSWMKSQPVGKIWHTVTQWTTHFSVSVFIFSKSIGFGFLWYEQFCRLTGVLSASIWTQSNLHVRPPLVSDHLP